MSGGGFCPDCGAPSCEHTLDVLGRVATERYRLRIERDEARRFAVRLAKAGVLRFSHADGDTIERYREALKGST